MQQRPDFLGKPSVVFFTMSFQDADVVADLAEVVLEETRFAPAATRTSETKARKW